MQSHSATEARSAETVARSDEETATSSSSNEIANTETFLQLLIAQIKNQDPLNPTDSVEFLTQLAQFSELEQLIAVRNGVDVIGDVLTEAAETEPAAASDAG